MEYIEKELSDGTLVKYQKMSNKIIDGINLVGKAMTKKYPFLTGKIEFINDVDLYGPVSVDLEMNFNEFREYMGNQPSNLFNLNYPFKYSYLQVIVEPEQENQANQLQDKMNRSLNNLYQSLPQQYQIHYQYKFEWKDE